MDTVQLENLMPRLSAAESDLRSIRQQLRAVITAAHACTAAENECAESAESAVSVSAAAQLAESLVIEAPPISSGVKSAGDYEALLAGKWLHVVGLLLVFIGAAFFLKVAFDHDWIT